MRKSCMPGMPKQRREKVNMETKALRKELREAVADYMSSEGCGCCEDSERQDMAKARLAKLLKVPAYKDGSGYNFNKFATKSGGE